MRFYYEEENSWENLCANLDFEGISLGYAEEVIEWKRKRFCGDALFRLYFPTEGKFNLLYFSEAYPIVPGFRYLVPPVIPFHFQGVTPSNHAWIHFYSKKLERLPYFIHPVSIPVDSKLDFAHFLNFVAAVRNSKTILDAEEVRHQLAVLTLPLVKQALPGTPDESGKITLFAQIIEYIDNHLTEDIRVQVLEQIAGLNRPEFSALFRKTYGIPPKQYITLRRVSRAKYLLVRTMLSVKEIQYQSGFKNELVFYRAFKKYAGTTPLNYRKAGLNGSNSKKT